MVMWVHLAKMSAIFVSFESQEIGVKNVFLRMVPTMALLK